MTSTFEWATYPRLLERDFFEHTRRLYELELILGTPIQDSLHWTRRFEYPWVLSKVLADAKNPYSHVAPEQNSPKTILDVGAGATALQFLLTRQNKWSVTAVDPDQAAIAWIEKTKDYSIFQTNRSVRGGFPVLPFKDKEFDTGICISVLEHLGRGYELESIWELVRVVKREVLITMDICLEHSRQQTDYWQLEAIAPSLFIRKDLTPPPDAITFCIDGHPFAVACIHVIQ